MNPQPLFNGIYCLIPTLIPFLIGFGIYPLLIPGLVITFFGILSTRTKPSAHNLQVMVFDPGYLLLLTLTGLFFAAYRGFYLPYHPNLFSMPWAYFQILLVLSALTLFWISLSKTSDNLVQFLWVFCLGSLLFCIVTIGLTIYIQKPPFYGSVIDIRYLPFGVKKFINTPGIANLLCLFPIAFLAGLLLKPQQRPKGFWVIGILGSALSLVAAIAIGQRSYFAVTLLIEPVVIALFLLLLGSWRKCITIFALLAIYPVLRWIDVTMGTNFLYRPLNQNLLGDARFQILEYWIDHLKLNPFQRIEVGPAQFADLQWFHNFFADIHRLSGFWALLAAVILVAYIFIRVICVIRVDRRFGLFLMAIAIPCFLIMNTSVVPEGERQPFLFLLAIGAITEVTLSQRKRHSKIAFIGGAHTAS